MKASITISTIVCSLILFTGIAFTQTEESQATEPQATVIRVDVENSWATLGRLYVIVATMDNDETFGKVAENNSNVISRLFRANVAQKAVTVLKIPAENISRQTVLSLITNLPLREDDAVAFYYSGKGNRDNRHGQYFEFSASKEECYRSEVLSAILAKKVRLCVLLSDLCDSVVANQPPVVSAAPSEEPAEKPEGTVNGKAHEENVSSEKVPEPESAAETSPLFFSLFFYSRGVVDIHSAAMGQASCAGHNEIGKFTEVFAGLLNVNRSKMLSWRWMFPYLREGTSLAFMNNFPHGVVLGEATTQLWQTPILLQLGNTNIDSETRKGIYPGSDTALNVTANEDEERRAKDQQAVVQLLQYAMGELRPFNATDRGTHENLKALDVDNTVLGLNGKPFSKTLDPATSVASVVSPSPSPQQAQNTPVRLGIRAEDNQGDGVKITAVMPNMPGDRAGLIVGDVILEIDDKKITSEKEYSDAIDAASGRMRIKTRNKSGKETTVQPFIGNPQK